VRRDWPSTKARETALRAWSRVRPRSWQTTAVDATLTRRTWSRPTLLKEFFEGEAALDFVGLDHGGEDVAHEEFFCGEVRVAGEVVGDGQDGAEVVGGVAPLGG